MHTLAHRPEPHAITPQTWAPGPFLLPRCVDTGGRAYCLGDRTGRDITGPDEGSGLFGNGGLGSQQFRAWSRKMSADSRWALLLTPQSLPRGEGVARTARVLSEYLLVSYVCARATVVTWGAW